MSFAPALSHGALTKVVDGVHVVRGSFQMGPGLRIGRTMTIVESGGGLVVLNAMRLTTHGEEEVARLGEIRHVVKLSDAHGVDEPYYLDRYRPTYWALPGARLPAGVTVSPTSLGPATPFEQAKVFSFPGATLECALWLPVAGGTLITCDALQNHDGREPYASWFGRFMTPILGFKGGVICASMWRKIRKLQGAAVAAAFTSVLAERFENLVMGHGPPVVGGADAIARAAVERASAG